MQECIDVAPDDLEWKNRINVTDPQYQWDKT